MMDKVRKKSRTSDQYGHLSDQEQLCLKDLDQVLHGEWALGRNLILVWTPTDDNAIDVLVVPHYAISDFAQKEKAEADLESGLALGLKSQSFIEDIISSGKQVTIDGLNHLSQKMEIQPTRLDLTFKPGVDLNYDLVEEAICKYSISYVEDRAVALFDIVGFSLFSPLEQVTQLNSLSFSFNSAYSRMLAKNLDISFARSTTGDGFYIWNRDRSVQANINLYHFMHLVLADNAIALAKSSRNATPKVRVSFHVGGHYEFYQSEGLSPTVYSYIVGDVTIELARMIDRALPGQVVVGDFKVPMPDLLTGLNERIDTIEFIERTQKSLSKLEGITFSGDEISDIRCYLTGEKTGTGDDEDDDFAIRRYRIVDKHGLARHVYNAKINIYRSQADPIFLGRQTTELKGFKYESSDFAVKAD